ncbi:MAG: TCR/Tet family MFS transporter [Flavobacterium sp.]|nr:TCR/Tet family MFS transporter [Candidatus Neoflavobacterium equi]
MAKGTKQAAMGFIFITMLIDVIGLGIIIPVVPKLLQELSGADISEAARIGGLLAFAYAFTQFLFAPLIGNLSDQFGRRPIILISLLFFSMDYVFLAFAPSIAWLFVGRIIAGITGASISSASAYIADISTKENKAKNFGMIGAAFGMGFIIGPVLGGVLGHYGSRVPFIAAAVLCAVNFIYGYFMLPESLPVEKRRKFDWRFANPVGALMRLKKYPQVITLIIAVFLMYVAANAVHGNWSYFTMYKFGWDERMVGISMGAIGLAVGLVQGGVIRWLNPKIGNAKSILLGLILYAIGLFLFSTAQHEWLMFAYLVPYCLGGIAGPAFQATISEHVPPDEQGQIQGTLSSLNSATAIIGPLLMTNTFYYFTHDQAPFTFAGAPFLLGGLLTLVSLYFAYTNLKNKL